MSWPVRDPASGAPTLGCVLLGVLDPSSEIRFAGVGVVLALGVSAVAGRGVEEGGTAAALGGATVGAAGAGVVAEVAGDAVWVGGVACA